MIEIITQKVEMPPLNERRWQNNPKDLNGKKWNVVDTQQNRIVYTGKFEEAALISHNLNKKFYLTQNTNH